MNNVRTGIGALDLLLFGDPLHRPSGGFEAGDVVLIRGEPGSGKTTLALQIVSNVLRESPLAVVQFVAMEESRAALRRKQEAYGFDTDTDNIEWLDRKKVGSWIKTLKNSRVPTVVTETLDVVPAVVGAAATPAAAAVATAAVPAAKQVLPRLFGIARTVLNRHSTSLRADPRTHVAC